MLYCYIVQRCKCNRWLFSTYSHKYNQQIGTHLSKRSNQISRESNVGGLSIKGKKGTLRFKIGVGLGVGLGVGVGVGVGTEVGKCAGPNYALRCNMQKGHLGCKQGIF